MASQYDLNGKLINRNIFMKKIPVLEIDGGKYTIAQSKAIERFLARRFNMLGSNDIEAAIIGKGNLLLSILSQYEYVYE